MAFIHSMTSKSNTHGPGCTFMNTGYVAEGFPAQRRLGQLRAGQSQRQPAHLRGDHRRSRRAAHRERPTGPAASCRPSIKAFRFPPAAAPELADRPRRSTRPTESDTREMLHALNARHAAQHPGKANFKPAWRPTNWRPGCSFRPGDLRSDARIEGHASATTAPTTPIRSRRPTPRIACSPGVSWSGASAT